MPRTSAHSQRTFPRRKACDACAQTKVRCDRNAGTCARCHDRKIECLYAKSTPSSSSSSGGNLQSDSPRYAARDLLPKTVVNHTPSQTIGDGLGPHTPAQYPTSTSPFSAAYPTPSDAQSPGSNRSELTDLVCTIDASAIQNRWLNAYLPDPEQRPKVTPPTVNAFVGRMLKSYVAASIRHGDLPPFVHERQLGALNTSPVSPLRNCFNLLKLCKDDPLNSNKTLALQLLEDEMARLYDSRPTFDHINMLAAFQAYLVYTITLCLILECPSALLRQHMMNLQQLASDTCTHGTVCAAELQQARPDWSAWIYLEAKRRSLYVMYLLDNLLCVNDGTPVYIATELRGLPAPGNRQLWHARSEEVWRAAYNLHLADWNDSGLRLDELWKPSPDMTRFEREERRKRIDLWLEGADEYCTMLYAVTSCTHGE